MTRLGEPSTASNAKAPGIYTFYPMVGSTSEYVPNLLRILGLIDRERPLRGQAIDWLRTEFTTSYDFARKVLDLLRQIGLIGRAERRLTLTRSGANFLRHQNVYQLGQILTEKVVGLSEMLVIVSGSSGLGKTSLFQAWIAETKEVFPRNQFEHRLNWLRGLNFVDVVAKNHIATQDGLRLISEIRSKEEPDAAKRLAISHSDLEDRLVVIGQFFEFEAEKRPSINNVLPSYAIKLAEGDRQLDCLWVRYVHFGGKMKFPIEVHLGGNMADTLDRLETVSEFVQKAILVTTEEQQKHIIDRLKVKRSSLLDKLVMVAVDDVYKAAEATSILKSFTSKIFAD